MKSKEHLIEEIITKANSILKLSSISDLEEINKMLDKSIRKIKYLKELVKRWDEDEN